MRSMAISRLRNMSSVGSVVLNLNVGLSKLYRLDIFWIYLQVFLCSCGLTFLRPALLIILKSFKGEVFIAFLCR